MLGRLRMDLKACEAMYNKFSDEIFTLRRSKVDPRRIVDFVNADGNFDATVLEDLVKTVVNKTEKNPQALLKDEREDSCKVYV